MRIRRFLVSIILVFSLLVGVPTAQASSTKDITGQLLNYYQHYQEDAWADIQALLAQLEDLDAERAKQWKNLMESWVQINHTDLTQDTLPGGLPGDDSLCIVVMGYQLGAKGSIQPELEGRLQIALTAAHQYPNAYILVTGGPTSADSGATEAGRMADWLVQKGISSQRIIQENQAYSTEQNAIYGLKLLKNDYPQVRHLAIITSDYHMIRSHLVFAGRQAEIGGEINDIVGHACYQTSNSTVMSPALQAELLALMLGQDIEDLKKPALSKLTGLTVHAESILIENEILTLTATAEYENGFTREVSDGIMITGLDITAPGPQTIKASYTENGVTLTNTIGITVVPAETEAAPDETTPLSQEDNTDSISVSEAVPKKNSGLIWLVVLAVVLVLLLVVLIWELRQQYLRRQRKKRRKIKKMNLE